MICFCYPSHTSFVTVPHKRARLTLSPAAHKTKRNTSTKQHDSLRDVCCATTLRFHRRLLGVGISTVGSMVCRKSIARFALKPTSPLSCSERHQSDNLTQTPTPPNCPNHDKTRQLLYLVTRSLSVLDNDEANRKILS